MRVPVPSVLGCISLVLTLLEPPPATARPDGRQRRGPPSRSPHLSWLLVGTPRRDPMKLLPHPRTQLGAPLAPWPRLGTLEPRPRRGGRQHHRPQRDPQQPCPSRGRRHTSGSPLRGGCLLGTCQLHNLSHRLWQLVGQAGRQEPSPISPHSPHSYG